MPPIILSNLTNFFSFVVVAFLCFNCTIAMEKLSEQPLWQEFVQQESKKKVHNRKKNKKKPSNIDEIHLDNNVRLLKKSNEDLDRLFKKVTVRVTNRNTKEIYETLFSDFIKGSFDENYIVATLKKETGLSEEKILSVRDEYQIIYFTDYVEALWKKKLIRKELANEIIAKNLALTHAEMIKLFQNGASLLSNNLLLEIKCGDTYGNLIEVEDHMLVNAARFEEIRERAVATHLIGANEDIREYLNDPLYIDNLLNISGANGLLLLNTWNVGSVVDYIRRNFLLNTLINSTTWFSPMAAGGASTVNPVNSFKAIVSPAMLTSVIMGNHYFSGNNSSISSSFVVNPLGVTLTASMAFANYGTYWYLAAYDQFILVGGSFTKNFADGTFWSNSQPTFLSIAGSVGGWSNMIQFGANFQTILADGTGVGASATVTLMRSHNIRYNGQAELDGKIPAVRGMHKIEVDDLKGIGGSVGVSVSGNQVNVPVSVAFKAMTTHIRKKIYRTHVSVGKAQEMLSEEAVPGLLYLFGKKIRHSKIPDFSNPTNLLEGDEIVHIKTGSLMGAFVLGLASLSPIYATRFGASAEMIAEFELGLRRLPNNKYEVSIEPVKVLELSLFESMLTLIGAGVVHRVAMAKKQIFIFDFNNPLAVDAYYRLVDKGELPCDRRISVYYHDRGAEYLLSEFRAQNKELLKRGVARTFLEQVDIDAKKLYAGLNAPIVSAAVNVADFIDGKIRKSKKKTKLVFDFFEFECMKAEAASLLTNGMVSILKQTSAIRKARAQGTSGKYTKEIFVTHRRVHTIKDTDDNSGENKWNFDSLSVSAVFNDTVITGEQENKMVDKINRRFITMIDDFEIRNSRAPRTIIVKREIDKTDLFNLTKPQVYEKIDIASSISGINKVELYDLIEDLKYKHADHQGLMIKSFISNYGIKGFSAIHQLLDADIEKLFISSQSSYFSTAHAAQKFILQFSNPEADDGERAVIFDDLNTKKNKKLIKDFYKELRVHLRNIDRHLRLLYDDKYFIDENTTIYKSYGKEKIERLLASGARQNKNPIRHALVSARQAILELLDYEKQGFTKQQIIFILKSAKESDLRFLEKALLMRNKFDTSLSKKMSKRKIKHRFTEVWSFNKEIVKRLEKLDQDHVMQAMDPDYVKKYREKLENASKEISEIVSINHLSEQELQKIGKRFHHKKSRLERFRKIRKHDLRIEEALIRNKEFADASDDIAIEVENVERSKSVIHDDNSHKKSKQRFRSFSFMHEQRPSADQILFIDYEDSSSEGY